MTNTHVFYFSPVPPEDHDGGDFIHGDKHYYYKAEYNGDELHLTDTCGRFLPLSVEHVKDLGLVLFATKGILEAEKLSIDAYNKKIKEVVALVEHFNDGN